MSDLAKEILFLEASVMLLRSDYINVFCLLLLLSVGYCGVTPVLERPWKIIHVVHLNQVAWPTQNCRMFTSRVAILKPQWI